jgi:hypothetical protein
MKFKELKLGLSVHNPSICEYEDGYLCVAPGWDESLEHLDYLLKHWRKGTYFPGLKNHLFLLNSDFEVTSERQSVLQGVFNCSLLATGTKILMFGNMGVGDKQRMCYAQINSPDDISEVKIIDYPSDRKFEKNWSPFFLNGNIYLVYSVKPFKVIKLKDDGASEDVSTIDWELPQEVLGELHGGTRAIPYGEERLSLCHSLVLSSTDEHKIREHYEIRKYKTWAYTFSTVPPFRILKFTKEPILDGEKLELGSAKERTWGVWLSEQCKVVLERGLVLKEKQVVITYGEQDLRAKILLLEKDELDDLLTPVEGREYE